MNDWQKHRFTTRIVRALYNSVADKKIAVLGFAFKKDTNDTRESAAIFVCRDLIAEQARVTVYDPRCRRTRYGATCSARASTTPG
jgi:UDPglucose 6-dehydrogenase